MDSRFLVFCLGIILLGGSQARAVSPLDTTYVRFNTNLGSIDVQLYSQETQNTVANFQSYITSGAFTGVVFNRSVSNFVIQAGYCSLSGNTLSINTPTGTIASEAGISNKQGTIAMALSNGPNTGSNQWFFNVIDNSSLLDGTADGGPFTVFGAVANLSSLATVEEINSVTAFNEGAFFAAILGYSTTDPSYAAVANNFTGIPLINFSSGSPSPSNLIVVNSITPIVLQDFPSWQNAKFTTTQQNTPGFTSPTATPWNDGVSNLLKYLCDVDPSAPITPAACINLPTVGKAVIAGTTYQTLTYHQFAQANGVKVNVQTSSDLQTWTTVNTVSVIQTGTDSSNDPILELVVPLSTTEQFVRLNLTQ